MAPLTARLRSRLFVELATEHARARGVELVGFDCGDSLATVAVFRDIDGSEYRRELDALLAGRRPASASPTIAAA